MRKSLPAVAAAALTLLLLSCSDTTTPITQEQSDQMLAATVAGATVDPNAETSGGHTAATPPVTCTYDAAIKWTTCTSTQNGLTIARQMQFLDGAGVAQQRPDTNTRSMKSKTTIAGTVTITGSAVAGTTTVYRVSDETVTGLAPNSIQRIVNGTATGSEDSQGKDARGTMAVKRQYADTTKNLTLTSPPNPLAPYPVSGTIIRNVKANISVNGAPAKVYTTREVQTFSADGKLTITTTMNGQTRTCVVTLSAKSPPVCAQN